MPRENLLAISKVTKLKKINYFRENYFKSVDHFKAVQKKTTATNGKIRMEKKLHHIEQVDMKSSFGGFESTLKV